MNDDERDAAVLRVVKERSEAKKQKALLESELRAAGRSLASIGSGLSSVSSIGAVHQQPSVILRSVDSAPPICELSKIRAMLAELRDVDENLKQLNATARELGIE